jgi:membrane-associated phospholipid phosphatase
MGLVDRAVLCLIAVTLILGVYDVYFMSQRVERKHYFSLETSLDRRIRYRPAWVWVYTIVYYVGSLSVVFTVHDHRQFVYTASSYVVLLGFQLIGFMLLPVKTPDHWRWVSSPRNRSERFLQLVQRIDKPSNCFPSMHTSVAILTALHIANNIPQASPFIAIYPVLIAVSAVYTKQHFVVDVLAALIPGPLAFVIYVWVFSAVRF